MGHRIMTAPIDGIRSNFKTSYSLVIKLLETKSIDECRALIERGFGSYMLAQRLEKKARRRAVAAMAKDKDRLAGKDTSTSTAADADAYADADADASTDTDEDDALVDGATMEDQIDAYRKVLQRHTLKEARNYLKLVRRLEKESRNQEFLLERMEASDQELVHAIADYMPLGIGIQLRNGKMGFFLGDVKFGAGDVLKGYGVLTTDSSLYVARKEHIKAFAESQVRLSIHP